jgi:hypothetical protein
MNGISSHVARDASLGVSLALLVASCASLPASSSSPPEHRASEASSEPAAAARPVHDGCEIFSPDGAPVPVYSESGVTRLPSGTAVQCAGTRYVNVPDVVYELAESDPPTLGFADDLVQIRIDGRAVWTGADHVVRASHGSPDGRWLVHLAEVGRGDCRHCSAWILSPSRKAIAVEDISCETNWEFSADSRWLALGSWNLRVFALEGEDATPVHEHANVTSPAYTPGGRLFARRNIHDEEDEPDAYGEHWQCVEYVDGAWQVAHPGAPQRFERCEECSCGPDELPPKPIVGGSGLRECPLPPSEQHPVSF